MEGELNMYIGYIYIVYNLLDKSKVYIGQTRTSLKKRWTQHKSSAKHAKDNKIVFYNAINKYGENNFIIEELEKIESNSKDELVDALNDLEIYYIDQYNSLVPNGYNLTKGGGNTSVRRCKPVTSYFYNGSIDKTFESATLAGLYYHADTSHILQCCDGKAQSCMSRIWRYKNESFDKYEITITESQLINGINRKIDKYTLDGKFIKSYNSLSDAIKDDEKVKSHTPISYCCDGKYNQAYGYVWRNHNEPFDLYNWKENQNFVPVDIYDMFGNFLFTSESVNAAFRKLNLPYSAHALDCCNNKRMSCNGYIWRYKGEPFETRKNKRKIRKDINIFNRYDLKNNYIETIYGSKNLPYSPNEVYKCCNGIRKYIDNSKWFYADDENNFDKTKIIGTPKHYDTDDNLSYEFNKFIEPICVYDRYGHLLNTYSNAKEISKEENISTQTIYDICDGKIAYNNGLVYRYKNDSFDLYYTFEKYYSKHINVYDKNNFFIFECFDIKECIRKLNIDTTRGSSIQKCLSHDRKYAYGYQFFRVNDISQPDKSKIITSENYKRRNPNAEI